MPGKEHYPVGLLLEEHVVTDHGDVLAGKKFAELERCRLLGDVRHEVRVDADIVQQRGATSGTGVPDEALALALRLEGEAVTIALGAEHLAAELAVRLTVVEPRLLFFLQERGQSR